MEPSRAKPHGSQREQHTCGQGAREGEGDDEPVREALSLRRLV